MLTFANVAPNAATSKTATIALGTVPSTGITTADSDGKRVEKPLPEVMISEANPARDAGFMQGFISCSCEPCAPDAPDVGASQNPPIEMVASERAGDLVQVPKNDPFLGNVRGNGPSLAVEIPQKRVDLGRF
jgi:hypothetical protein